MIEAIHSYAQAIGANAEVFAWLETAGKKALVKCGAKADELEHIVDFLVSPAAPARLLKMSFADAKRKAAEWSASNQKKGRGLVDGPEDLETIHDFLDGTRIVKLKTKKALQREGFLMSHCVGGYSPDSESCHIYSYRDAKNLPHATFEVQKRSNEIVQIKGKGNGAIHPRYIHPILAFLTAIGMDVRPDDMRNLGYYHVDPAHLDFLKRNTKAYAQVVMIGGEAYAF